MLATRAHVDVPVEGFLQAVTEHLADVLALFALLTTTTLVMEDVVVTLEKAGLRNDVKGIVVSAPISQVRSGYRRRSVCGHCPAGGRADQGLAHVDPGRR